MNEALRRWQEDTALPGAGWWILLAAALALHMTLPLGWIAALGLVVLVLVQLARPFDFNTSVLLVVAGASVINYSRGALTFELSILTVGIVFMLFCYLVEYRGRAVTITHTPMTLPLALYSGLSILNFVRGLMAGNPPRYAGLELIAVMAMTSALLIANRKVDQKHVRLLVTWLWTLCLVHTLLGVWAYAVIRVRVSSIFFTPVPGVVFALLFNFALRARSTRRSLIGLALLSPLLVHQFLSFTRGFWFAMIGSTLFSIVMYTGRGPGVGARWKRTGAGLLLIAAAGVVVTALVAATIGIGDIADAAGSRFASSTGTEMSWETASNIVRLSEYFHVLDDVIKNPVVGYGLGYDYVLREPIGWRLIHKWYVHQNYLLVTLKQGLIGLALFLWVMVATLRTGLSGRKLPEDWQRAWCMGAAGLTVWLLIYCMVHFPLAEVNTTFTAALAWGTAMSLTHTHRTTVLWRAPAGGGGAASGGADGGPGGRP